MASDEIIISEINLKYSFRKRFDRMYLLKKRFREKYLFTLNNLVQYLIYWKNTEYIYAEYIFPGSEVNPSILLEQYRFWASTYRVSQ